MTTNPLRLIASLAIDYLRWTQLTPMVLFWGGALLTLLVMFVTTNEDAFWQGTGSFCLVAHGPAAHR